MDIADDGAGSSPGGVADSKLRRLLAYNKFFNSTNVKIGEAALFPKTAKKRRTSRRRGPANIVDIGEAGVTAESQSQTFDVARCCVRKAVEGKDVEGGELNPLLARMRTVGPTQ